MQGRYRGWSGAVSVMAITAALVVLDLADGSVHRYWSRHSFTSSVLSGLLVLLLTVLIVDRVARLRQLSGKSLAVAAQAAVIVGQAARTVDSIERAPSAAEGYDAASEELRAYTRILLASAPVLIEGESSRAFLETAQRLAGQLFRAIGEAGEESAEQRKKQVDAGMEQLRRAAGPVLEPLSRDQRVAASSDELDPSDARPSDA